MQLTILIPCLNEAATITDCIVRALGFISQNKLEAEVLVADNGSTDGSIELAEKAGARVIAVTDRGYGSALFHGVQQSHGKFVIMADADGSYDFSRLEKFIEKLNQGYDIVIGNRFQGIMAKNAMPWKNRYIGNPVLSWLGAILFKIPVGDFHCGLRAVTREAFKIMDLKTPGMEFASEMIVKASLRNLKIAEVPIDFYKDGRGRPPHLRPWRDGWRHLKFMLILSPTWLFFYPGVLLLSCSLLLFLRLCFAPIHVYGLTLDIHTLMFSVCGFIIGTQSVSFAVLSHTVAKEMEISNQISIIDRIGIIFEEDAALILSLVLAVCATALGVSAFLSWRELNFGDITDRSLYGSVLGSVICFVSAGQLLLNGFFCSFLKYSFLKK